jgi:hypothetical protein
MRARSLLAMVGWLGGAASCAGVLGWDLDGYGARGTAVGATGLGDAGGRGGAITSTASAGAGGALTSTGGAGGVALLGCDAPCGADGWCDEVFGWCVYEWPRWPMPSWKGSGLPHEPTYTIAGGAVHDSVTGLVWQRAIDPGPCNGGPTCRWHEAHAYCRDLALDGGGWRLPSMIELYSLVRFGDNGVAAVMIDADAFPGTPPDSFWSATCADGSCTVKTPADEAAALAVDFFRGRVLGASGSSDAKRVRCVR